MFSSVTCAVSIIQRGLLGLKLHLMVGDATLSLNLQLGVLSLHALDVQKHHSCGRPLNPCMFTSYTLAHRCFPEYLILPDS